MDAKAIARFWSKVSTGTGCWEWQTGKFKTGYGAFSAGSRTDGTRRLMYAHRVSWQLTNGPIPDGLFVCHHCDNPSCVNPGHLFLGTQADNVRDCASKGRRKYARGDERPSSVLSNAVVRDIREKVESGMKQADVHRLLGISRQQISRVVRGDTWASCTA